MRLWPSLIFARFASMSIAECGPTLLAFVLEQQDPGCWELGLPPLLIEQQNDFRACCWSQGDGLRPRAPPWLRCFDEINSHEF